MTIVIAFHGSGFRTFKDFYTLQVLPHWRRAFPDLVSYTRFVELMPWSLMALLYFLNTCGGEMTGISFIDSTSVKVCHPQRAHNHKVFQNLAGWGKSSVGWYFGFKLHLIINDRGEILSFALTPGNTDDRNILIGKQKNYNFFNVYGAKLERYSSFLILLFLFSTTPFQISSY